MSRRFRTVAEMCGDLRDELAKTGVLITIVVYNGTRLEELARLITTVQTPGAVIVPGGATNNKEALRNKRECDFEIVIVANPSTTGDVPAIYSLVDKIFEHFLPGDVPNQPKIINGVYWEPVGYEPLDTDFRLDLVNLRLLAVDFRTDRPA